MLLDSLKSPVTVEFETENLTYGIRDKNLTTSNFSYVLINGACWGDPMHPNFEARSTTPTIKHVLS